MSNRNISWRAAGLVVVVFGLGIALGAFGIHVWDGHVRASETHHSVIRDLKGTLQLTPDREKQFDAIIADERSKFHALDAQEHSEWDPKIHALRAQEHAEWDPKWDQVRQQGRDSIRAILTPDQRAKFDAFVKHLDEENEKKRKQEGN
ncbi:MAG: Spy/CpxP family protein refolding chaperone [Candidatus Acidiferrales bacterium]